MTSSSERVVPWSPTADLWVLTGLGCLVLGVTAPFLGVWEPWEADTASVAENMKNSGQWLRVLVGDSSASRAVSELPYGYWPVALSMGLLSGLPELAIRLPTILLAICILPLLFSVVARAADRWTAWLSILILLMLPLFNFQARFAIGQGFTALLCSVACLCFLAAAFHANASDDGTQVVFNRYVRVAWVFTAFAGLSGGVPGLLIPVCTLLWIVFSPSNASNRRRYFPVVVIAGSGVLLAIGWWRAAVHMPGNAPLETLLLWTNGLSDIGAAADRPAFNQFVHQIGFGLFPLGAILPLALTDCLNSDEDAEHWRWLGPSLAIWIAAAFLGPALGATYSHIGFFLGAPAAAFVLAVYFDRMVKDPPRPVYALVTVMLVALLDSNLKHDTRLFADTLVGDEIDSFPAQLAYWKIARWLDFALLGFVLVYQGGVLKELSRLCRACLYPNTRARLLDWRVALAASPVPLLLWMKTTTLNPIVLHPLWRRTGTVLTFRRVIVGLIAFGVTYFILLSAWNLRVRLTEGRSEGRASSALHAVHEFFQTTRIGNFRLGQIGLGSVITLWIVFMTGAVSHGLTTNFSQKDIITRFQGLAGESEKLFKYKVKDRNSSFYARDLPTLKTAQDFSRQAKEPERFFMIIPRDKLAAINNEFRRAVGRTLPILDDSSSRVLLASNIIRDGEQDRSPINSALIEEMPGDAQKVTVNFEDKIELVGWKVEPIKPRSGSPATLHMFWRAKVDNPGTWKIFVHIDAAGQRIHGDHDPVEGLFPTRNWKKGDLVHDVHQINVKRTISPARFTFYAGLYRGSTRMKIKSGPKDSDNRARLGKIDVR